METQLVLTLCDQASKPPQTLRGSNISLRTICKNGTAEMILSLRRRPDGLFSPIFSSSHAFCVKGTCVYVYLQDVTSKCGDLVELCSWGYGSSLISPH